jgi:hypothetical protein
MNAARRKALAEATVKIEEAKGIVETARDEEQDAFDNLSDKLKSSEKGEMMESNLSELEQAIDALDAVLGHIESSQNA